jgi:hypothetical protein
MLKLLKLKPETVFYSVSVTIAQYEDKVRRNIFLCYMSLTTLASLYPLLLPLVNFFCFLHLYISRPAAKSCILLTLHWVFTACYPLRLYAPLMLIKAWDAGPNILTKIYFAASRRANFLSMPSLS